MKPYTVTLEVTTRWTMEVHAENEEDAQAVAEDLELDAIENGGDFGELSSVEVMDIEVVYPEDEDEEGDELGATDAELLHAEDEAVEVEPEPKEDEDGGTA